MKVAINICFGGFGLSDEAFEILIEKGWKVTSYTKEGQLENPDADIVDNKSGMYPTEYSCLGRYSLVNDRSNREFRSDPNLIEVVEKLGDKASGRFAELKVVEIPDGISWEIDDYDGNETIKECHRSWR